MEGGADGDFEAGAFMDGKAGGLDDEVVSAGGESDKAVLPGVIGGGFPGALPVGQQSTHAGVGDDGAGGVEDGSGDDAIDILGQAGASGAEYEEKQKELHSHTIMPSHYLGK